MGLVQVMATRTASDAFSVLPTAFVKYAGEILVPSLRPLNGFVILAGPAGRNGIYTSLFTVPLEGERNDMPLGVLGPGCLGVSIDPEALPPVCGLTPQRSDDPSLAPSDLVSSAIASATEVDPTTCGGFISRSAVAMGINGIDGAFLPASRAEVP